MIEFFNHDQPRAEQVLEAHDHLRDLWQPYHAKNEKIERFLKMDFDVWDEKDQRDQRPNYHPGTARNTVDDAVDLMMAFEPQIDIEPNGEGQEHDEKASTKEEVAAAIWRVSGDLESVIPVKQLSRNLIGRGYGNMELTWEEAPEAPYKRDGEDAEMFKRREIQHEIINTHWNPLKIRAYNPTRVLMPPFETIPSIAIKVAQRTNVSLHNLTTKIADGREGVAIFDMHDKKYEVQTTYEVWTPDNHMMVTKGGELVFDELNVWGFVAFIHKYSGWGDEFAGEDGSDPQWLAAGILESALETLLWQARIRSGLNATMMREAFTKMITTKGADEAMQVFPGNLLPDSKQDDWAWLQPQQASSHLFQQALWLDQHLEQTTLSSALSGLKQPGVNTVGQQSLLNFFATRKFVSPSRQISYMASVMTQYMFRMIDLMNQTIMVDGHRMTPRDIDGSYNARVVFEQIDPIMQMEEKKLEAALVGQGLSDWWSFQEVAKKRNVTEMFERRVQHEFFFGPKTGEQVMGSMVTKYAEETGQTDLLTQEGAPTGAGLVGPRGEPLSANPPGQMPGMVSPAIELARRGVPVTGG